MALLSVLAVTVSPLLITPSARGVGGRTPDAGPVANDDRVTFVNTTDVVYIYPTGNDDSTDWADLAISAHTQPGQGSVTCDSWGCEFTPATLTSTSFTYTISDSTGTDTATVFLEARNVTAVADAITFPAGEDVARDILGNDTGVRATDDVRLDVPQVSMWRDQLGRTVFHATTPGTYTGTYTIQSEDWVDLASAAITITVEQPRAMATMDDWASTEMGVLTSIPVGENDTYADDSFPLNSEASATRIVTAPQHGTALMGFSPSEYDGTYQNLPVITYTPDGNYHGPDSLTYRVTDAQGRTSESTVAIDVTTDGSWGVYAQPRVGAATIQWFLTDSPNIDAVKLCWTKGTDRSNPPVDPSMPCTNEVVLGGGTPETAEMTGLTNDVLHTVGLWVHYDDGTPAGVWSEGSFDTFRPGVQSVYDVWAEAGSTTATVHWTNPVEGSGGTTVGWSTSAPPLQPGSGATWVTVPAGATEATLTGLTADTDYHVSVFATQDTSWADPQTEMFTTRATNTAPAAVDDSATVDQNAEVTLDVLANDSDADGDPLTIRETTDPAHGWAWCSEWDGTCSYTPNRGYSGSDSFTYTVHDGHMGRSTATVSITVVDVPEPPEAWGTSQTVTQGIPARIDLGVLASDPDPGDTLTWSVVIRPTKGSVTCEPTTGLCTYTATASGADGFTYRVTDSTGRSAEAAVTLTVLPNQPPTAGTGNVTVAPGASTTVDLRPLTGDPDGDPLTYAMTGAPAKGTAACTASGSCTYTAHASATGQDSFGYTVTDSKGASASATVLVDIVVTNRAPVAQDAAYSSDNARPFTVDLASLATDADNDPLTYSVVAQPAGGTGAVTCSGSTCTYTPPAGWSGTTSFTWKANDGTVDSNVARVTLTVTQANRPPVAVDDTATTTTGTPVTVDVSAGDSDPDGDPLDYVLASPSAHGSATCTVAGSCTYTPNASYVGADSFTYEVRDGRGGTDVGTVTVTVQDPLITITTKPWIKGKLKVGKTLTAMPGSYTPTTGVQTKYQWFRGTRKIKGATKRKYALVRKDRGKRMKVRITYTYPGAADVVRAVKAKRLVS